MKYQIYFVGNNGVQQGVQVEASTMKEAITKAMELVELPWDYVSVEATVA